VPRRFVRACRSGITDGNNDVACGSKGSTGSFHSISIQAPPRILQCIPRSAPLDSGPLNPTGMLTKRHRSRQSPISETRHRVRPRIPTRRVLACRRRPRPCHLQVALIRDDVDDDTILIKHRAIGARISCFDRAYSTICPSRARV